MPFQTHDPYLNTVKREIDDKYYRHRKEIIAKRGDKNRQAKGFLSQKVSLSNFINLDESTLNILGFIAFAVVPYITGITLIFLVIANANFDIFESINIKDYFIFWSIGYEFLAVLLILLIIKSAISFKRATYFHKNSY